MITTLHTLSIASITHHTNSPHVRLRRPSRAWPQLTRPPLPTPVLCRPSCPPELHQSARLPVLAARCPTIARHRPRARPQLSPRRCSPPARRLARRQPRAQCPTRVRFRHPPRARPQLTWAPLLGCRCPPRCCATRRAHWSCASLLARLSSQRAARPSPATHRSACLLLRARP